MILVVGGQKGGAGKSCISQNLMAWLIVNGHGGVIVDGDPQGTTAEWIEERNDNTKLPKIPFALLQGNISDRLRALEDQYTHVVVDMGGADSAHQREALLVATHFLMPIRPKRRDLKRLPHLDSIVSEARKLNPDLAIKAVISQAPTLPSQMQRIVMAKDAIASFDIPLIETIVYNRNSYDDADEGGSTAIEVNEDLKAVAEINNLATELWS